MSNLVEHAERELRLIETDEDYIQGMLKVVQAFSEMGHSGGSAMIAIPTLHELLQYKNLRPLTNDPEEWFFHEGSTYGSGVEDCWQNKRNGEAFSYDGGKTYYLLSEGGNDKNRKPIHVSEEK